MNDLVQQKSSDTCTAPDDHNYSPGSIDGSEDESEPASVEIAGMSFISVMVDRCIVYVSCLDAEVWSDYSSDVSVSDIDNGDGSCPSSPCVASRSASECHVKPVVTWLVTFFLLLQAKFHIRSFILEIIMKFLKVFFVTLGKVYGACLLLEEFSQEHSTEHAKLWC